MSIKDNTKEILLEIPKNIRLVAASKTRNPEEIKQAIDAGIKIIGENYIQEAQTKYKELKDIVKIHCIGHIQTNKAKIAAEIFDMIQTVDSLKLSKELNKRCKNINKVMPILIEVNSGKEPNKDGCMPNKVLDLVKEVSKLENLKIDGLMTMAPYYEDPKKDRPYFKLTKELFDKIKQENIPNVEMNILSMGMSHSYKIAIEEGANMVRIGSSIFGKRKC